jgi:hypothetical protein
VAGNKIRTALFLLGRGCWGTLMQEIRKTANSHEVCYGFRRDLAVPFEPPRPDIPIRLRPFRRSDAAHLFDLSHAGREGGVAIMDCLHDLAFIDAAIPTCFVATTHEGTPCYIQWLISHHANKKLNAYFGGYMPPLERNEVVLEGAFIPFHYRGKRIMPLAMARIAEKGRGLGARFAMTYVQDFNLPSIRCVLHAGFRPYIERTAVRRPGRRDIAFRLLSDDERTVLETGWENAFRKSPAVAPHRRAGDHPLPPVYPAGTAAPG